jgi:hypothetical protein
MGQEGSMVIVLPGMLPKDAPNYTVAATPSEISIRAGYDEIAKFPYKNQQVFDLLTTFTQVGIVEYPPKEAFPNCITAVAYVQTRH